MWMCESNVISGKMAIGRGDVRSAIESSAVRAAEVCLLNNGLARPPSPSKTEASTRCRR